MRLAWVFRSDKIRVIPRLAKHAEGPPYCKVDHSIQAAAVDLS